MFPSFKYLFSQLLSLFGPAELLSIIFQMETLSKKAGRKMILLYFSNAVWWPETSSIHTKELCGWWDHLNTMTNYCVHNALNFVTFRQRRKVALRGCTLVGVIFGQRQYHLQGIWFLSRDQPLSARGRFRS